MNIYDRIHNGIFILDGGTGSILQERGLQPGELPETWNITHPEEIERLAREYYESGSNAVCTNTFGANSLKYDGKDGRYTVREVVTAAVKLAKSARDKAQGPFLQKDRYVGLDIGPLGKLLKPLGDMEFEDAVALFKETITAGVDAGVDYIAIETMNDAYETKAAVVAAKEVSNLPIFVTTVFDESMRLMTGATPEVMSTLLSGLNVFAYGANCSLGPQEMLPVVDRFYACSDRPVIFKPNAGMPKEVDGKTVYDTDADTFAKVGVEAVKRGARILGGCCGTTPLHIRKLFVAIKDMKPLEINSENGKVGRICSFSQNVVFGKFPVLIGERINPTGKKKLKEALKNRDLSYILGEAVKEEEAGCHVLDVNVGLPELNEPEMLTTVVRELQAVTAVPLQLDTSDSLAMEQAMRVYNGIPMVNSVNGKEEVMAAIFPLVKKYGGFVVCLTLDEKGIPETAEKRLEIAKKIIETAASYGIERHNLIFDPLAMAVSSDSNAARVTLDSIRLISEKTGCYTSLGVSNVSFGLPNREVITSIFFTMAMEAGLSAAIMNPFAGDMMKAWYSFMALSGKDEGCMKYIEAAEHFAVTVDAKVPERTGAGISTGDMAPLQYAIVKGMSEKAAAEAAEALKSTDGLTLINEMIIPALNEVGKGFEEKRVYLPQLLMSAEAAKYAFQEVSKTMPEKEDKGPKVIMATVKGDIHDIGKNIVVVLLKNYGFDVYDLGKDVEPEHVVEAIKRTGAKMVGLSALMTTTVPSMQQTIELIKTYDKSIKVVVGGAVLTQEYADMIGADFYAANAMETVRIATELLK